MWLVSPRTALAVFGAMVGIGLVGALTGLPLPVAVTVGGIGGWFIVSLVFGEWADRLERSLHRMGGPRRRRRRIR